MLTRKSFVKTGELYYSSSDLIAGNAPEGVYICTVHNDMNKVNDYIILIRKTKGNTLVGIGGGVVGKSCHILLSYYKDSGELHPGTPVGNYKWKLQSNLKVFFDIQ